MKTRPSAKDVFSRAAPGLAFYSCQAISPAFFSTEVYINFTAEAMNNCRRERLLSKFNLI